jgi:hypothetical protein
MKKSLRQNVLLLYLRMKTKKEKQDFVFDINEQTQYTTCERKKEEFFFSIE